MRLTSYINASRLNKEVVLPNMSDSSHDRSATDNVEGLEISCICIRPRRHLLDDKLLKICEMSCPASTGCTSARKRNIVLPVFLRKV
ncbi:hypothetical protein NEOLEDRAFT_1130108 [Neolentinus lepideus HHB14362 ss-1]|uniref:Uncharacterized protein n=1 Tax=Neolentinus lepideus HHB14362 ss-1 TaxID=1314782 RepID=A0A165UGM2_9AGAM|nr:hypothetical protein NEOLEDRAFT_1130108 [Neolentinus lepideus HHB14362 ss-1]